jgi:broad specificity phosphatase PhoE
MGEIIKPKWPKLLVVVRHGQSEQNAAIDLLEKDLKETLEKFAKIRDMDIALTSKGIQQALETGKYLAQYEFDICFSSPYKRTMQTAQAIVSKFDYDIRIFQDNRLREKEFGRLHGLTTADIKKIYPREYEDRKRDGKYWYRLLGGENYPDVEMRVHSFLDKLVRDYSGKNVLVNTHHVPCVFFRALFEHLDEKAVLELGDVPNCGISEYVLDTSKSPEGRMKLKEFGKVVY